MQPKEISILFSHKSIRVECICHLATQATDYALPSILEHAILNDSDAIAQLLGFSTDESDVENFFEDAFLYNKFGFLVQFATPIPVDVKPDQFTHSWSYYTTKWFYGDDYLEVCEQAIQWRDEYVQECLDKAKSDQEEVC
ncbi:MAG: hypothetical protein OQJ95_06515 [Kangiella sp.]|nr:hypothetical protein [Kangiella sp.]MCW9029234.1 hypothetical protein [Kangiella sp.]